MKVIFIPLGKRNIYMFSVVFVLIVLLTLGFAIARSVVPTSVTKEQLSEDLKQMFIIRDKATMENNIDSVKYMFDSSFRQAQWAFEHEKKRAAYLKNWSIIRNTKFTEMSSDIRISRVRDKGGSIWVDFLHAAKFTYAYNDLPNQPQSFGIGSRRTMELLRKDDKWVIKREWYLDPFEDVLEIPEELKNEVPQIQDSNTAPAIADDYNFFGIETAVTKSKKRYDREKAVAYAEKYSGATFGSSNNYRYNKKYRDYTGLGGDCTNFTSQVLGDSAEGGGLRMDGGWFYNYKYKGIGGGTQSWVRAGMLKNYLIYSGKAQLIAKGTLEQVSKVSSQHPNGAFARLQKGDLVAYECKGKIDHFSVITGFDPKGLPLVNSHTTDRYHVPWDLGWSGKDIKYWLLHIRD